MKRRLGFLLGIALIFVIIASSSLLCSSSEKVNQLKRVRGETYDNDLGHQVPHRSSVGTFTVFQYNIFGTPVIATHSGQTERFERIPNYIAQFTETFERQHLNHTIDVITFCEAFIDKERELLLQQLAQSGWKYHTKILKDPNPFTSLENGGVIIASKWPIVRQDFTVYRNGCAHADCLAAKGAVYARIEKSINGVSKIYNVFATHMQAWYDDKAKKAREQQSILLHAFQKAQLIPRDEPVIFSGDFNVDLYKYPDEVSMLTKNLETNDPKIGGNEPYTSDPKYNGLVGRDGAAKDGGCEDEYQRTGTCTCCPREFLDYSLYHKDHQQPLNQDISITPILVKVPSFEVKWSAFGQRRNITDLSDHFPVVTTFTYQVNDDINVQDGCKIDNDCHFKWGTCYCIGDGCTYNGTIVNGYDLGAKHPVNRHCHINPFHPLDVCTCTFSPSDEALGLEKKIVKQI